MKGRMGRPRVYLSSSNLSFFPARCFKKCEANNKKLGFLRLSNNSKTYSIYSQSLVLCERTFFLLPLMPVIYPQRHLLSDILYRISVPLIKWKSLEY
jgi:hypothetical protein